jgi:hypothetical protein
MIFTRSLLLIAQNIGRQSLIGGICVLNGKVIFSCCYYRVNNHWQIYQHNKNKVASGRFETLAADNMY